MTWVVLATGPSMSQALADSVSGRGLVVAVSDAYRLAPWADAVVSTDAAWWGEHPGAKELPGRKFTAAPTHQKIEGVERLAVASSTNSGLLGIMAAVHMGAKRVMLCGFDMRAPGQHFFGLHPKPLKTTTAERMEVFKRQFRAYRPAGVEIINCTPGSHLLAYPFGDLEDCLAQSAVLDT
ncbi:hypothetical protein [Delftia tsuruhatensis]|uniref:Uncharacterized protein n=1 Tax=Delftia tsuruhatensis TaxID=180282 RepID=A0ABN4SEF9_9BURK|nr:hypothetical protein [Delftia tsuruhatensis]AOV01683.1 hypothetical protein BI380_10120 [Delftia tsuruhatensis]